MSGIDGEPGPSPADICPEGRRYYSAPDLGIEEHEVQSVADALADERWDFRTIEGIAEDTGLEPNRVYCILTTTEIARQSPLHSRDKKALFRPRESKFTWREELGRIRYILAR